MRWTPGNRDNIEDARGRSGGAMIPLGIGGFIVVALLSMFTGIDFFSMLGGGSASTSTPVGTTGRATTGSPTEERTVDMVDAVARDVQDTWQQQLGSRYEQTRVVLFRDSIQSACGFAESATGPFYCPGDHKVYLDLSFFDELRQRFGAPGEFAEAYVLAHEFGHHVQNLTGTEARVRQLQRGDPSSANQMSGVSGCRPTATRASGDTTPPAADAPRKARSSSIPATPTRRSAPPPRSATIACSGWARAA
jgi:predicted metalloprotease